MKPKLLWIGDAVVQTGFARVTHNILDRLKNDWDVHVLGLNYMGDPHEWEGQYKIYPAQLGGDVFGIGRLQHGFLRELRPDVILILNDPWIIRDYLSVIPAEVKAPILGYMPVDSPHQHAAPLLSGLTRAITYTQFGRKELYAGGFNGRCDVIPHGVDTNIYKPMNRNEARKRLKFKDERNLDELFIVGQVNRNTYRKRLDLTIMYWTQWWINAGQPKNAILYMHTSNRDEGWNVLRLAKYFGIDRNFVITSPTMQPAEGISEADLAMVHAMFDVELYTPLGEGWGLNVHEAMACMRPPIVPRYSALGEWARGGVHYVECTSFEITTKGIDTIGGVADREQTVSAIDMMYKDLDYRHHVAEEAYKVATQPQFNWDNIAKQFHLVLMESIVERQNKPVGVEA